MSTVSHLSCEETFARLNDYLDRALSAEERRLVEKHLENCLVCASEYRFEGTLISEIRQKLQRIDLPDGVAERITRRLQDAARGARDP